MNLCRFVVRRAWCSSRFEPDSVDKWLRALEPDERSSAARARWACGGALSSSMISVRGCLRGLRACRLLLSPLAGWNSVVASERSGEGVGGDVAGVRADLGEGCLPKPGTSA